MASNRERILLLALMLPMAACAARRPVLYPNETLNRVGDAAAQRDIDACMQRAQQAVGSGHEQATQTAGSTATGAATGAAIGAVGGAVVGNAGEGAAVGAATGGTAGLLHGLFGSSAPDPVFAAFVERCLRDRGYDPIGWR